MSAASLRGAGRFTRSWTRVYTTGLPCQIRQDRRDEIASDLWEHAADAGAAGAGARATAAHIFGRAVLGMPADIVWHVGELKGTPMDDLKHQTLRLVAAAVVGVLSIATGIGFLVGLSQGNWSADDPLGALFVLAIITGIAGPFVAVVGLYALRRAQAEGQRLTRPRALLVGGTVGVALLGGAVFWTIVGPLIAIGILGYWAVKIGEWRGERPAPR